MLHLAASVSTASYHWSSTAGPGNPIGAKEHRKFPKSVVSLYRSGWCYSPYRFTCISNLLREIMQLNGKQ